jgi:branched-chain amino acid transport system ATP-binding protein
MSIGRALMTHPALIVLEEATEGLAPLIVADIWRVLARADHALVRRKGLVVQQRTADELANSEALSGFLGV